MTDDDRCDRTELLTDQCGCPQHRGGKSPAEEARDEIPGFGSPFPARYSTRCTRCSDAIEPGDLIRSAGRFGNGGYLHECCP